MDVLRTTFLPGLNEQFGFLTYKTDLEDKRVLVIGSSSANIALMFAEQTDITVDLIVEDYDSLINSKLELDKNPLVNIRLMDFENTDFNDNEFDIIYAQGTTCDERRAQIVKEIKRIAKPEALFCIGEMLYAADNPPTYIRDIFESAGIEGLKLEDYQDYYKSRGFEIVGEKDLSFTLSRFYKSAEFKLKSAVRDLEEHEKSYHKKLIKKIKHESDAFLTQGGDKYIRFIAMVLKRS